MEEIENLKALIPYIQNMIIVGTPIVKDIIIPMLKKKGVEITEYWLNKLLKKEENKDANGLIEVIKELDNCLNIGSFSQNIHENNGLQIGINNGIINYNKQNTENTNKNVTVLSDLAKKIIKEMAKDDFGMLHKDNDMGGALNLITNGINFGAGADNQREQRKVENAINELLNNSFIIKISKNKYKMTSAGDDYFDTLGEWSHLNNSNPKLSFRYLSHKSSEASLSLFNW